MLNVQHRLAKLYAIIVPTIGLLAGCGQQAEESPPAGRSATPDIIAVVPHPSVTAIPIIEPTPAPEDELRRLRNQGCACLDNDEFKIAIGYLEECRTLSSNDALDVANLGMALYGDGQLEAAEEKLRRALAIEPDHPTILYHLGLTCKKLGNLDDAAALLKRVTEIDPLDATSFYQLGSIHDQLGRLERAERSFLRTIELDATHASSHYRLMGIYRKQSRREEMKTAIAAFRSLRETTPDSKRTEKELERGKHSGAIWPSHGFEGAPLTTPPKTTFVEVTSTLGLDQPRSQAETLRGRIALADIDRDTLMDFIITTEVDPSEPPPAQLFRNLGGFEFERSPLPVDAAKSSLIEDVQFGDFDNDGDRDLFLIGNGVTILENTAGGRLAPATDIIGLPTAGWYSQGLLFDQDHDGDLDVLLVPAPTRSQARLLAELYRNDGSRQFTDITEPSGLPKSQAFVTDVSVLDADEDDDTDILFATTRGLVLLTNLRQGKFADISQGTGLAELGPLTACDAADINHDGLANVVVASDEGCMVLRPQRFMTFVQAHVERRGSGSLLRLSGVRDLDLCDLNGDGNQDLVVACEAGAGDEGGLRVFFGDENGFFTDVTDRVGIPATGFDLCFCKAEDIDQDGDPDLLVYDRKVGPRLFRNDTQGVRWISLILHGTKNNTEGIGTKVEAKVRNSYQKLVAERDLIRFGIGGMSSVDVVRLQWPNGVLQGATQIVAGEIFHATEKEGEVGSCPYLYTWNGQRFVFVTDVIDTCPLGLLIGQDVVFPPRDFEVVRITDKQLKSREDRLLLRFTEELRELTYFDQVVLEAIDHPAETEVYPDERFSMPPFPSGEPVIVHNSRPPVAAWDGNGNDVLDLISRLDHRYPVPGARIRYAGFTEGQTLTLDLGDVQQKPRVLLLLIGCLRWGYSSSLYAISQDPVISGQWPSISIIDEDGSWREILPNYGFPAGKMKTMLLDLTGKFPTRDCRVRIETNMEIYWDRILVDTSVDLPDMRRSEVPLVAAHLRRRGYCEQSIIDGKVLSIPEYGTFNLRPPYPLQVGFYTRFGDVSHLIDRRDDDLVVFNQGDELAMAFDYGALPPLPEGWRRTYLAHIIGWVKDGDINTVTGATVEPMPYRAMTEYPYPRDAAVVKLSPGQTRRVDQVLPPLEP